MRVGGWVALLALVACEPAAEAPDAARPVDAEPVVDAAVEAPDACRPRLFHPDVDGDGRGDPRSPVRVCEAPPGYVENGDDPEPECATDDTDECGVCGGPGPRWWYADADHDGRGDPEGRVLACVRPVGFVDSGDDPEPGCATDDTDECGACAGPGPATWYGDQDGDGLGDPALAATACAAPEGFVDNDDDPEPGCPTNDTDACGVCAGPGPLTEYRDADGDGLGDPADAHEVCAHEDGFALNGDDPEPDCRSNDTDACGVCGGRGRDRDCNGDCFGEAAPDPCGVCSGGATGREPAAVDADGDGRPDACDACPAPNPTRFVVQWEAVPPFRRDGEPEHGPYTFELLLFSDGVFKFQYGAVEPFGASATIGWQVGAEDGVTFARDNDFVLDHRTVQVSPAEADRLETDFEQPFEWVDASGLGEALELADDGSAEVALGFQFPLGGRRYDRIRVSANGLVAFAGELPGFQNGGIPDGSDRVFLAPFWDDLNPATGGGVYVHGATPACEDDCAGDPGGVAFVDACGVCVGGSTGLPPSARIDCNGDCDGGASIDACGRCAGGNTGLDPEAAGCLPDLVVDEAYLRETIDLDRVASDDACLLAERCITGLGERTVVRFGTRVGNVGVADLRLGAPVDGVGHWHWDACHNHFHFEAYAEYSLVDVDTGEVIPVGHKNGFSVIDSGVYDPALAPNGCRGYGGRDQGITSGCQDTYRRSLACQWVDVTDVEDGVYDVVVTTNPLGELPESNLLNNSARVRVRLADGELELVE